MSTIEYESVTAAHNRTDREVNRRLTKLPPGLAPTSRRTLDPSEYNPEHRADVLARADVAADAARERVHGQHWRDFLISTCKRSTKPEPLSARRSKACQRVSLVRSAES